MGIEYVSVLIGIQARSGSKRFPRKVHEQIGGKPTLQHVIDACESSSFYMNKQSARTKIVVSVAVLIPYKDEIKQSFGRKCQMVEGPDDDVLTRYKMAADKLKPDYIVRVTADCPLIPPFLITKHINTAVMNRYDYVSNVDERSRTTLDGMDCEVMSSKMLQFLDENAKTPDERQHVTLLARTDEPKWAKIGHVVGYCDLSLIKLSVDTLDDLERVRAEYDSLRAAIDSAEERHGKQSIHRF